MILDRFRIDDLAAASPAESMATAARVVVVGLVSSSGRRGSKVAQTRSEMLREERPDPGPGVLGRIVVVADCEIWA
jgi:hypothetical protein